MTPLEALINQVREEMDEVGQVLSKILRFGLESVKPGDTDTNRQKLVLELNDVLGSVQLLKEYLEDGLGGLPGYGDPDAIETRIQKILHFAGVSAKLGLIVTEDLPQPAAQAPQGPTDDQAGT
jgi:hypothetical protein